MYTPTSADTTFVDDHARGQNQKLALMIMLKVYQRLHYFPEPQIIPGSVISHIRSALKYPPELVPDISSATLFTPLTESKPLPRVRRSLT